MNLNWKTLQVWSSRAYFLGSGHLGQPRKNSSNPIATQARKHKNSWKSISWSRLWSRSFMIFWNSAPSIRFWEHWKEKSKPLASIIQSLFFSSFLLTISFHAMPCIFFFSFLVVKRRVGIALGFKKKSYEINSGILFAKEWRCFNNNNNNNFK